MGKPAARMGDTTSHGGTIVAGAPTVLIGGMPAARAQDMHVCPLVNPGTPPPPHVGGPILMGSPTVLICGMMAACMGDTVQCSGPPDSIVGGCPTVLIGGGGGGGAGAGGPGGAPASAAMAGGEAENEGGHFLDVKFVDKAGKPIKGVKYDMKAPDGNVSKGLLGGQIKKTGIQEGNYEIQLKGITKAEWSKTEAKVGDKVKLKVETAGIDSGETAKLNIFVKDINRADEPLASLESQVSGDSVEVEWLMQIDDRLLEICSNKAEGGGYSQPLFYFTVQIAEHLRKSNMLKYKDWVEVTLKDEDGNAIPNKKFKAYLPDGRIEEGKLDSQGKAKIENVPPGKVNVKFDMNS